MKKIIWAVLATAVSSLAAALAVRALDRVWRSVVHEPPPPRLPAWTRLAVARPVRKRVIERVRPGAP